MLKKLFLMLVLGCTFTGCARYEQYSHGQVETAQTEQAKMTTIESQLKDQGLEFDHPSRWRRSLAQWSVEDLKALAETLKNYLHLSKDVEHIATLRGVHSLDVDQTSKRTKRAQSLFDEVTYELSESGN